MAHRPPRLAPRARTLTAVIAATLLATACARAANEADGPDPLPRAGAAAAASVPVDSALVRFVTSQGEIDIMLRTAWAPHGTQRVRELVDARFFDGARFFRALRGFVLQFGIAADTAVTAAWRGRSIPDDTVRQSNRRGTLVFAAGGPNTRTTQLFLNLRDNARLDAMGFAPLGEVVRGIDAMDALHTGYALVPGGPTPSQDSIARHGEAYLARAFPLLDRIVTARVVRTWPAAR
jgi:cyclophilin family peptidyl-prolyl cis-trans isomerase